MTLEYCLFRLGVCQAPTLTTAHQCVGFAGILGCCFVVTHLITIIITCAVVGFDWGAPAWCLDLMGFFAGFCFIFICKRSSNTTSVENRKNNTWICIWAAASLGARVLDTLMLFGIVKLDSVYITPSGAVLASNIVSEVIIGNL